MKNANLPRSIKRFFERENAMENKKTQNGKTYFNEMTRVQMPALMHLTKLGYKYFGKITEDMAGKVYDKDTNILREIFISQFKKLNPFHKDEAEQVLHDIIQELDNDDLGRSFYTRLKMVSPVKLIDFAHPENNEFHFTAEFTCKRDQDEFRPDITLFVNGLPLVFVEVKKPNNYGGMVAESKRMNRGRFPNKKFRRFINITQLMIFSNNMEYDAMGGIVPIQGVFYCSPIQSTGRTCFITQDIIDDLGLPVLCTNFCRVLRLKKPEYAEYVYNYIVLLYTRGYLFNLENNTTGIKNLIFSSFLKKIKLPIPKDLRLLDRFLHELDNYSTAIEL